MSTAYKGLIGKLGKDIFKNPGAIGRYAGIGAGVGVVGGAMMSDDGIMSGAMRGGVFGAALGAGIHWAPRAINKTIKDSGFIEWDRANTGPLLDDVTTSFGPAYVAMNHPTTRKTGRALGVEVSKAFFSTSGDAEFATQVQVGLANKLGDMGEEGLKGMVGIGGTIEYGFREMDKSLNVKDARNFFTHNKEIFDNLDMGKKVGLATSVITKMGFDSAYHHIVEPTGKFIRKTMAGKKPTMGQSAAAAFSLYGGYEAYHIGNDVADGNKLSALGGVGMLIGGKLAFSGAANAIAINKALVAKGMTPMGVAKTGIGIGGLRKLDKGTTMMNDAQRALVADAQLAAHKKLKPDIDNLARQAQAAQAARQAGRP